jgi:hypothetical protein
MHPELAEQGSLVRLLLRESFRGIVAHITTLKLPLMAAARRHTETPPGTGGNYLECGVAALVQ